MPLWVKRAKTHLTYAHAAPQFQTATNAIGGVRAQHPPCMRSEEDCRRTEYYDTNNDLLCAEDLKNESTAAYPPVSSSHLTRSPKPFVFTQRSSEQMGRPRIIKIVDKQEAEDVLDPRGFNY
jgi:hypothetical protein